jgi:hypothetical protein
MSYSAKSHSLGGFGETWGVTDRAELPSAQHSAVVLSRSSKEGGSVWDRLLGSP